jgi:hypothetical protein
MGFVLCDFHLRPDKRLLFNIKSCQNCHCLLYRRHADIMHVGRYRPWALRKDNTVQYIEQYIVFQYYLCMFGNNSYILESASHTGFEPASHAAPQLGCAMNET